MLKPFSIFASQFVLICGGVAFLSCQSGVDKQQPSATDSASVVKSDSSIPVPFDAEKEKAAVLAINQQVLAAFKVRNYQQLPTFIHPVKGVRFSLYGYIDTAQDQGFSPERLADYTSTKKNQKLVWGTEMANGDSICLTVPEYFTKELYKKNFSEADSVGYNIIYRTGTDPEMMETVYGHAPFVSNYFAGDQKKYGGLDWLALRLVFEKYDEQYYLVGVINDEWTP